LPLTFIKIFKFLAIAVSVVLFAGCANENNQIKKIEFTTNPHAKYLESNQNNHITGRTTRYTISEALEYLNDGMNYLYCRPGDVYNEGMTFTDTFSIAISSGAIEEDDLIDLMDEIAYFAGDLYYADSRTVKEPIIFHMVQVANASSSVANIEATFLMEAGLVSETEDSYPYELDWVYAIWYGENNEECNEQQNNSACLLLHRDLNKNLAVRTQYPAFYLKDPEVVCFDPGGAECVSLHNLPQFPHTNIYGESLRNPNDVLDNLFDFLLFRNNDNYDNFSECLSVNEMNFYYESQEELALDMLPSPANDRVIAALYVGWDRYIGFQTIIWHPMKVITATIIEADEDNAIPLPCHCH
jgi:hypothetical protein